ncbi:hypothetical protein DRW07_10630 [Alteromonas sediminis]|uniref:Uncharacterized protein n=1 Tax=Alteromonas sediminis TaxID=2259342 RepID=A0A3N5YBS5_9ALTE|nr:hypothetical protein [Alteromonas sediminis]RPJ66535.1 hypothetical protein DRW07_10630 [Alteromonas sediminis]
MRKAILPFLFSLLAVNHAVANPLTITENTFFPFGQKLSAVLTHLETHCTSVSVKRNLDLEVPTATESQTQVDCKNYAPLKHDGLSEWVFADDSLDIVWVLSPMAHLQHTKATLTQQGISADYSMGNMADFYLERGFGFRYQPTEYLYFSDRLKPFYKQWLEHQS